MKFSENRLIEGQIVEVIGSCEQKQIWKIFDIVYMWFSDLTLLKLEHLELRTKYSDSSEDKSLISDFCFI